jgi:hypothetical protein
LALQGTLRSRNMVFCVEDALLTAAASQNI